jgi:transposase
MTVEERALVEALVSKGKHAAATQTRARILLKADEDGPDGRWSDERIAEALEVGLSTIYRVRQAFVEQGLQAALYRKRPSNRQYRKLDGAAEAQLVALACSAPPEGRTRWTLQLLADKMVALKIVDTISDDTVQRTLKKTTSNLG